MVLPHVLVWLVVLQRLHGVLACGIFLLAFGLASGQGTLRHCGLDWGSALVCVAVEMALCTL